MIAKNCGSPLDHDPAGVDAGPAGVREQRAQHLGHAAAVGGRVHAPHRAAGEQLVGALAHREQRRIAGRVEHVAEALGGQRPHGHVGEPRHACDASRAAPRRHPPRPTHRIRSFPAGAASGGRATRVRTAEIERGGEDERSDPGVDRVEQQRLRRADVVGDQPDHEPDERHDRDRSLLVRHRIDREACRGAACSQ